MNHDINHLVQLAAYPEGEPKASDFELVEEPVPEPQHGQVLVRNIYLSVDPYMRGRMRDQESYVPPYSLHEPIEGGCVGQVVESRHSALNKGDYVLGGKGWREWYTESPDALQRVDPERAPLSAYLGVMGMPGMTAYVGFLNVGRPEKGDTVFVSGAAGAVGSVVCQIARIKGCRVVGAAGSDRKTEWLRDRAGVDVQLNYKTCDIAEELAQHCPDGLNIYYDNVGGKMLDQALAAMAQGGRIVLCGMISQYNAKRGMRGPSNLFMAISKRLRLQGFIVWDFEEQRDSFVDDMSRWIAEGSVVWEETVVDGIDKAADAFMGLFEGNNLGKMLVKVGPDAPVG
jgi:NADPH-dependent curcumin reductase CurA